MTLKVTQGHRLWRYSSELVCVCAVVYIGPFYLTFSCVLKELGYLASCYLIKQQFRLQRLFAKAVGDCLDLSTEHDR